MGLVLKLERETVHVIESHIVKIVLQLVGMHHQPVDPGHGYVHHLEPHHCQLSHSESLTTHQVLACPVVVLLGVDQDSHIAGVVGLIWLMYEAQL